MKLSDIYKKFPAEKDALQHLAKVRWGNKVICPYCNSDRVTYMPRQFRYHCNAENRSFSVKAGTIFEESRLDLRKWFYAIALMLNAKKGLSTMQVYREAGVTYKTAWYCLMRIRCALADQEGILHSVVGAGKAFISGKPRKAGKAIAKEIPGMVSQQLTGLLKKNIHQQQRINGARKYRGYNKLDEFFNQLAIEHSKEFSKEGINLNRTGGFIGLLKRGLTGLHHKLAMKYLPLYLAEFVFRYNQNLDKKVWNKEIELRLEKDKCMLRYKYKPDKPIKVCDL
jgi:transposase-like protein